ncbi:hypothetical protein [Actinoplanes sp. NBRC 103695]|uniref:phasin family protein n=1 Tax=Actinoplanes sp. NBRC 103695 TaxID=3032202 RepID=UPI0024A5F0B8|nr:hypothetical protein Acsp02_93930 [Actinoplanes sp. NBRC 103695]
MQDAWRAYLEMALGLAEAPRKRAQKVASELVNKGGATATQLQGLVEDLLSTGMANREALTNIVRFEVDRALGVVGLATSDEVKDLTGRVRDLEKQLRLAQAKVSAAEAATGPGSGGDVLDKPAPLPAKKVAKKAVKKVAPTPTPTPAAPAPGAAAKAVPAKAVPAKKAAKATPNRMPSAAAPPVKKATPAEKATPAVPAGTAESPVASVVDAAAATEIPPAAAAPAKKAPAKKAAKKVAPVQFSDPGSAPAKKAPARKAGTAKRASARKTQPEAGK